MSRVAFVFIHKNTKSTVLNRVEDHDDKREINSHVQRASHAQRRSKPLVKKTPPVGWTYRRLAAKPRPHEAHPLTANVGENVDEIAGFDTQRNLTRKERYRALAGPVCHPSCALDTLPSIETEARPWAFGVLDYYANFWGGAAFKTEFQVAGSQKSRHREAIDELTRGAIHEPLHLFSLASAVSARLYYVSRDANALSRYGQSPCPEWFLDKGLRALRKYFANLKDGDTVDPATIYDIYCLYNAEFFARNYEAARTHLKIFELLAKRGSGSDTLSFYCRELWALGDIWMAIETLSPPVFVPHCTPLHPLRVKEIYHSLDPSERSIGEGFKDNIHLFSSDMAIVLIDVIEWAQTAQYIWSSATAPPHEARWLSKRASDLLDRLLQIPPPAPRLSVLGDTPEYHIKRKISHLFYREECVRITLVTYLSFILTYMAAESSGKLHLPRLKTALLNNKLKYDSVRLPHQELFVWVMFIGTFVAEQTGVEKIWFTEKSFALAYGQGIERGD